MIVRDQKTIPSLQQLLFQEVNHVSGHLRWYRRLLIILRLTPQWCSLWLCTLLLLDVGWWDTVPLRAHSSFLRRWNPEDFILYDGCSRWLIWQIWIWIVIWKTVIRYIWRQILLERLVPHIDRGLHLSWGSLCSYTTRFHDDFIWGELSRSRSSLSDIHNIGINVFILQSRWYFLHALKNEIWLLLS